MKTSIENLSGLQRKMLVELPTEVLEKEFDKRLAHTAKTFSIKGFRPGKAPIKEVKKRIGNSVRQEAINGLVEREFYKGLNEQGLQLASRPNYEVLKLDEAVLEFCAVFEVYPEADLIDFSQLEIVKRICSISDSDVDGMIEKLLEQNGQYQEISETAQLSHRVNINYEGQIEGKLFDQSAQNNLDVVIGGAQILEGFEQALIGRKAGDSFELDLNLPENYQDQNLAGSLVNFSVTVNRVCELVKPSLDAEFIKLFDIDDGDEAKFREAVCQNMQREADVTSAAQAKHLVMMALLEHHDIEVPLSLLNAEILNLNEKEVDRLKQENPDADIPTLPEEMFKADAQRAVVLGILINAIIRKHGISMNAERLRQRLETIAAAYEDKDDIIQWYYSNPAQLEQIERIVFEDLAAEQVLKEVVLVEKQVSYFELQAVAS